VRDRTLAIDGDRTVAGEHALPLRALAAAAIHGLPLERATADRLRGEVAQIGRLSWDAAGLHALTMVLRAGASALPALADADHLGVLTALWPEWSRVRGRPQRNPFHLFDLDTHHQQTVAALAEVAGGGLAEQHALLWQGLPDQDALLLAAFLHDVGKAWPGDHSVVGAEIAHGMVRRAGLHEERAVWVAELVRLHLLLPDVATRRDIDDPEELRAVADEVHDAPTLDALYLLSLADARATGPTATSLWKEELLAELHRRVRPLVSGADTPALPDPVAVAADLRAEEPARAGPLLAVTGARYLLAGGVEQALAHLALGAPEVDALRAGVRQHSTGVHVVSVVAPDRFGLLAGCAGVLAGHGLDVLEARLFTTPTGVALDWFVVRPRRSDEQVAWSVILADLQAADAGTLDVDCLLERRERRRDERRPTLVAPVPVEVRIDDAGRRVEVHAPDAPGVLSRIARTLAAAGADVEGARVSTQGPKMRDVFFLSGELDVTERTALAGAIGSAVGRSGYRTPPSVMRLRSRAASTSSSERTPASFTTSRSGRSSLSAFLASSADRS
jgi:[protein-PII] uridylyltransferase